MKYIFLTLILASRFAFSSEKIVEMGVENYIAHGYSENPSKELAKQESCNTAKRELIAYVFGAAFQINQNMIRSLGVLDYSQDISVNTGEVLLRAAMIETSTNDDLSKCTITYPIQEANIEKERLKSAQNSKIIKFTDIGDPNNIKGGVLEVVTIPEDTDVWIDNVRWGTTPLRLNTKLKPGEHTLRLENDNYKIVDEKFVIGNTKTRIDKILKRATGKLKIITDPAGALVKINEEEIGHSPTKEIELLAGQKFRVEVIHPEAETFVQNITLIRDEKKEIAQKLLLKPGFISLNVTPRENVMLRIDGVNRPDLYINTWIKLEAGTHEIFASAVNYEGKKISIDVRGGEKLTIPTIDLISLTELERLKIEEEKIEKQQENERKLQELHEKALEEKNKGHWKFAGYAGTDGDTFKNVSSTGTVTVGIRLGNQFSEYVGLESSLGVLSGEKKYSDAILKTNGYQIRLGLPVTFVKWDSDTQSLLLSPEAIYASHTYNVQYTKTQTTVSGKAHKQVGTGGSLGYAISKVNNSKVFFDFRLGAHKYSDADGLKGGTPITGGISIGVQW